MKKSILSRRHWEIFLVLILVLIPGNLVVEVTSNHLNLRPFDPLYGAIKSLIMIPIYLSYLFITWQQLNLLLSQHHAFIKTARVSFAVAFAIMIITPLIELQIVEEFPNCIPISGIVNLICLLSIASFPARQLKSIELKRNAGIWEYTPETLQFLFWPLGLWWIQPRINRIVTRNIIISE